MMITEYLLDDEPLMSKEEMKCGDTGSQTIEVNKVENEEQSRRKESGDENTDFGNGHENDRTDEEADSISDSDGRSSQVVYNSVFKVLSL